MMVLARFFLVLAVLLIAAGGLILIWTAPAVTLVGALVLSAPIMLFLAWIAWMLDILFSS